MSRILMICSILLSATFAFPQNLLTYSGIDSITYKYYLEKNHKELLKSGRKALRKGIDFYYLRMRLGISCYENHNYEVALRHFRAAHQMFPTDTIAQEYLFYCMLFTGRNEDAHQLASSFSASMQERVKYNSHPGFFETLAVTGGTDYNNNISKNRHSASSDIYTEKTLQGQGYMGSIFLKNRLHNRLKLFNAFSLYNIQSLGIIHNSLIEREKNFSNTSLQYNLGMSYRFPNQIQLGYILGYYKERSSYYYALYDSTISGLQFYNSQFNNNAYHGTLFLSYRLVKFEFGLSGTISNFSKLRQYQGEGTIIYYPLGNRSFYSISTVALVNEKNINRLIAGQCLGIKISKWLWTEVKGSIGNHHRYYSPLNLAAYNTVEPILFTGGLKLYFIIGKISIIPDYSLQQRESRYYSIKSSGQEHYKVIKYYNHHINLSLKWNFGC